MDRRDVTRLGTCCYCGARTMLELTARGGHELACGACGAPIHKMKGVPVESPRKVKSAPNAAQKAAQKPARPPRPDHGTGALAAAGLALLSTARAARGQDRRRKKKSVKKSVGRVFDLFEDAFDEVLDVFD